MAATALHSVIMVVWKETAFSVAALHQGAPGQMTWLEDPPPCLLLGLLCFGNNVKK